MLPLILCSFSQADNAKLKTGFESFTFENSKTKENGKRYLVGLDYRNKKSLFQILYSYTNTDTFQPPLNDDLHVNKVYLKATHYWDQKQSININFITINDNLMKEVDGGNIYGIGYQYRNVHLNQYLSDYLHFDAYQTDLKYIHKIIFDNCNLSLIGIGKYIHLNNNDSNPFSNNAKDDYLTIGLKTHIDYDGYHLGIGGFFGKRAFAVMFDGFRVQHHAMEFKNSYMIGLGRTFGDAEIKFKYVYQTATELPILNENVKVQNLIAEFNYKF